MTTTHPRPGHPDENLGEFAEELRLLAEAVLERVEPVLRRTASDGRTEWSSCSWCPVCAAAAIVRGEHHDVVAAIADHGTAIVTVLREALAGVPVDPVIPPDLDPDSPEYHVWQHYSKRSETDSSATDLPFADAYATARGETDSQGEGESPASGGESAQPGHPHAAGAGLAAVFARFLAGVQGRAAARNQAQRNPFGTEPGARDARESEFGGGEGVPGSDSGDPLGHGPGAARRPGATGATTAGTRRTFDTSAGPIGPPGGMPFGPPVAAPAAEVRRDPAASPDPGSAPGGTRPGAGRRPKRAKYVPIDVNIKA
ncbi:hypothetical protein VMT65_35675 [Nocardia sp. CDC153]|uniref:hypothetical protein n=1 Tax=Nocardia sp. CDC153 TaxID=3112167 RepID=UPI002DB60989|nr:hypothetical protein [Nocardia sp. CDC153]MEC3958419.1 hypothetical protein [Nocardia sp. CDC153]